MDDIVLVPAIDPDEMLDDLARRYVRADGPALRVLNMIGTQADGLLDQLPQPVRARLTDVTVAALHEAARAAHGSRMVVPDQAPWVSSAVGAAMGAAGGFGGLPTALAELPVTTTLLLRVIEEVASEHGFDPNEDGTRFDCVQVFAAAGPLEHDDGADLAFLTTRIGLSGPAMSALIARVAPRLATVLGQKLAAQAIPLIGAAAGAATNLAYTRYYRDVAHVHFGLRRLSIDADMSQDRLVEDLRLRVADRKRLRGRGPG